MPNFTSQYPFLPFLCKYITKNIEIEYFLKPINNDKTQIEFPLIISENFI